MHEPRIAEEHRVVVIDDRAALADAGKVAVVRLCPVDARLLRRYAVFKRADRSRMLRLAAKAQARRQTEGGEPRKAQQPSGEPAPPAPAKQQHKLRA